MRLKFYVDSDHDAERCGESLRRGEPISIAGEDPLTGRTKPYEGVVCTVEKTTVDGLGERWRVAMETELALVRPTSPRWP